MPSDSSTSDGLRDRDEQGRAHNARPRDELGRPLPYGSAGVARQPALADASPQQRLHEAQRLLSAGRPFEAHEVLEDAWKLAGPEERQLWRGLAQLAVGLTHAARGNRGGATALLSRGAGNLGGYRDQPPHGIDVDGLVSWSDAVRQALTAGTELPAPPRLRTS